MGAFSSGGLWGPRLRLCCLSGLGPPSAAPRGSARRARPPCPALSLRALPRALPCGAVVCAPAGPRVAAFAGPACSPAARARVVPPSSRALALRPRAVAGLRAFSPRRRPFCLAARAGGAAAVRRPLAAGGPLGRRPPRWGALPAVGSRAGARGAAAAGRAYRGFGICYRVVLATLSPVFFAWVPTDARLTPSHHPDHLPRWTGSVAASRELRVLSIRTSSPNGSQPLLITRRLKIVNSEYYV